VESIRSFAARGGEDEQPRLAVVEEGKGEALQEGAILQMMRRGRDIDTQLRGKMLLMKGKWWKTISRTNGTGHWNSRKRQAGRETRCRWDNERTEVQPAGRSDKRKPTAASPLALLVTCFRFGRGDLA
jgi:hypothetical protein